MGLFEEYRGKKSLLFKNSKHNQISVLAKFKRFIRENYPSSLELVGDGIVFDVALIPSPFHTNKNIMCMEMNHFLCEISEIKKIMSA